MNEQPSPRTDSSPFVGPLEGSGLSLGRIKVIAGNPDVLVRTGSERERSLVNSRAYTPEILEQYKTGHSLFNELQETYGVRNATLGVVVGEDESGEAKVMVVGQRIEGVTLTDALQNPPDEAFAGEASGLMDALSTYVLDKYRQASEGNDVEFLWDFNTDQFMYGKAPGDEQNSFYVVDTDPKFDTYKGSQERDHGIFGIADAFNKLAIMIDAMKDRGAVDTQAAEARVQEFVDSIPADGRLYSQAQEMKQEFEWLALDQRVEPPRAA